MSAYDGGIGRPPTRPGPKSLSSQVSVRYDPYPMGGARQGSSQSSRRFLGSRLSSGSSIYMYGENEFEMMDISVTILGLTGIVAENIPQRSRVRAASPILGRNPIGTSRSFTSSKASTRSQTSSRQSGASTASSVSSTDVSSTAEEDEGDIPVTAVITFARNVSSSQTYIESHLPSLPLGMPTSTFGSMYRYMATWPSDYDPILPEEAESDRSSFTFSRVMRRENHGPDAVVAGSLSTGFVPERVELKIGLARGPEMIALGTVMVVISGEEVGEVQVNLPVKSIYYGSDRKKKSSLFKTTSKTSKSLMFFSNDKFRKYKLDENATLRLSVSVTPRDGGGSYEDGTDVSELPSVEGTSATNTMPYQIEIMQSATNKDNTPIPEKTTPKDIPSTVTNVTSVTASMSKSKDDEITAASKATDESDLVSAAKRDDITVQTLQYTDDGPPKTTIKLKPPAETKGDVPADATKKSTKEQRDDNIVIDDGETQKQTHPAIAFCGNFDNGEKLQQMHPAMAFCGNLCYVIDDDDRTIEYDDRTYDTQGFTLPDDTTVGDYSVGESTIEHVRRVRRRRAARRGLGSRPRRRRTPSYEESLVSAYSSGDDDDEAIDEASSPQTDRKAHGTPSSSPRDLTQISSPRDLEGRDMDSCAPSALTSPFDTKSVGTSAYDHTTVATSMYDHTTVEGSLSEASLRTSDQSLGASTIRDIKKARDMIRMHAKRMGVPAEELL